MTQKLTVKQRQRLRSMVQAILEAAPNEFFRAKDVAKEIGCKNQCASFTLQALCDQGFAYREMRQCVEDNGIGARHVLRPHFRRCKGAPKAALLDRHPAIQQHLNKPLPLSHAWLSAARYAEIDINAPTLGGMVCHGAE